MDFDSANRPIEDFEYPEPDVEDDLETELITCSNCGESIYEEAVECPYCGSYVESTTPLVADHWYAGNHRCHLHAQSRGVAMRCSYFEASHHFSARGIIEKPQS